MFDPLMLAIIGHQLNQMVPQEPVEQLPQPKPAGLAGLATRVPPKSIKMTGPGTKPGPQQPDIIWNKDRTMWRYPASNAWHPASTGRPKPR